MGPDFNPWRAGYPERGNIICITHYCTIHGKKGAIASRRLDFYLLVHGRYFISLLPRIGNQWRRSPIRHLGTRPLGVTGSPISRRGFDKWKHSTRLKRSSALQLDSEIRKELNLEHSSLEFLLEPLIPKNPPKNTCFELELLQPCSKKEDPETLRQKGETIEILSLDNFAIAYTDGSSDISLSNGGAGILLPLPDGNNYKHKINAGIITSNFTSELMAIREALILNQQDQHVIDSTEGLVIFSNSKSAIEAIRNGETNISCDIITLLEQLHSKRKSSILQWIPALVNIEVARVKRVISTLRALPRIVWLWKLNNLATSQMEPKQRINEKQLTQRYLSHDIQNELIALMSKSVIEEIIHRVKQAKYYAFLLDCTRDVSRVEQMSIILRFCNSSTGAIEEHFVGFIAFAETTGEYITNSILQELDRNGLDIQNCRGQGYDNGAIWSVMKIHPDKTRSYAQCKHCPDLQLTPNPILECPTFATKLLKMGMVPLRDSLREILYSPDVPRIAEAVIKTFDGI
ncbi:zinc finger MYM-type protein 1 [Trichonephila clavipes]|nr:zinc finger MYM-type protein 1 [Trichonephila clavipes]